MKIINSCRLRFAEFVDDLSRQLGSPGPADSHDPNAPLALAMTIEGMAVEVWHSSEQQPSHVLIQCTMSATAIGNEPHLMKALLAVNKDLCRIHNSAFAASPETGCIVLNFCVPIVALEAAPFLDAMKIAAQQATTWKALLAAWDESAHNAFSHAALHLARQVEAVLAPAPLIPHSDTPSGGQQSDSGSLAQFLDLVEDICLDLGYPSCAKEGASDMAMVVEVDVEGFGFFLAHRPPVRTGEIALECSFGPLPESQPGEVMRQLLYSTYAITNSARHVFCIDSETNQVICIESLNLSSVIGISVVERMTEIASQARTWRENPSHIQDAPVSMPPSVIALLV